MGLLTTDPHDPRLTRGVDDPADGPAGPPEAYLVLPEEELAKGYKRPVRLAYWHSTCGRITHINESIAATFARDPEFYDSTYCAHCELRRPVGTHGEFYWCDPKNPERQSPLSDPKVGT